ncbi:Mating locus protein [Rasamsonia emersonii CBS 393.64]|uniref:Mating locus protein n=1 Tax=Rasamsonia emersonii (strain ATCC 16479 / CBS 393.64 / IMI 116815) TaxID=1408163 RepID=A0A0F4YMJ7_RASE3|nr:Mating locus protein [Rasamsonia emersonii CBS 393.64]KKA19076.1 Mating locus protein [Rasamsonia emersonii CBS 393.64]
MEELLVCFLLIFLRVLSQDPQKEPERRMLAFYMLAIYEKHRNGFRLMAQFHAFCKRELNIPRAINTNPLANPGTLVVRCGDIIENIVHKYGVIPTIADFEGHPCELVTILPQRLDRAMPFQMRLNMHKQMLVYERLADIQLASYARRYGYHYIFRAGLREYYMTKVVVEHYNFLRNDQRGNNWRRQTQAIFYEAIDRTPGLSLEELRALIMATQCFEEDVFFLR